MNRKAFKEFRETMKWWDNFDLELYYEILKQRKHEAH